MPTGLEGLLDATKMKQYEDALFGASSDVIGKESAQARRATDEAANARGMYYSSMRPYEQGQLEEARLKALGTAKQNAVIGGQGMALSGDEATRQWYTAQNNVAAQQAAQDLGSRRLAAEQQTSNRALRQEDESATARLLAGSGGGLANLLLSPRYSGGTLLGPQHTLGGDIARGVTGGFNRLFTTPSVPTTVSPPGMAMGETQLPPLAIDPSAFSPEMMSSGFDPSAFGYPSDFFDPSAYGYFPTMGSYVNPYDYFQGVY